MADVAACLTAIGVEDSVLLACSDLEQQFAAVRKVYLRKCLETHPDKGGDVEAFRTLQAQFETLRDMYGEGKISDFMSSKGASTSKAFKEKFAGFEGIPTPSWEFYREAESEPVPPYIVEPAKSGRSKCAAKGNARQCHGDGAIELGEVRVGSMNPESGTYSRYHHLKCWRVPSKVWLGLPGAEFKDNDEAYAAALAGMVDARASFAAALEGMNEVVLTGFSSLDPADQNEVVEHVMDMHTWAKLIKKKAKKQPAHDLDVVMDAVDGEPGDALVPKEEEKVKFVMPEPGKVAAPEDVLEGKTFVLTGTFPEVGGSKGLNLGKDKVTRMIRSFGGSVKSSITLATDFLLVGKAPGASKVMKARTRGDIKLVTLHDLSQSLEGDSVASLGDGPPLQIASFSAGFYGNAITNEMSDHELRIAAGLEEAPRQLPAPRAPRGAAKKKTTKKKGGAKNKKMSAKAKKALQAARKAARAAIEAGEDEDAEMMCVDM